MILYDAFIAAETHIIDGEHDNFLAKRFYTPDSDTVPFNREWFWDYLLLNAGHFQLIISDIDELCRGVKAWSSLKLHYWQKAYDALCAEYNPIHNYDRTEDLNENTNSTVDADNDVAGYDSGRLVDADHQTTKGDSTHTANNHIYGNIGVTTTQEMIKQELDIAHITMYDIIVDDFKAQFCVTLY